MKKMKRLVALALSVVMVLAMSVMALADEQTYSLTIDNSKSGHTYEAYQIFVGDLTIEGNVKKLSNIKWGTGISQEGKAALGEAAAKAETLKNEADAKTFSQTLASASYLSNPTEFGKDKTSGKYIISNLKPGYYLVKDKDASLSGEDVYTSYIMEVVGDTVATPKGTVPSFEKKIKDTNDTTGVTSEWQDSADYDIGDAVPFKLEGTVASNYADYKGAYYFAFHDVEEETLTFNPESVKVYVDDVKISTGYEIKTKSTEANTGTTDNCSFEVIFSNLKNITSVKAGSKIRVEYTSTLNNNAALGSEGNVNKAKLEFSNNPNEVQEGTNKPGTGETPWDNVIVFTYKVIVNKVKEDGEALSGAKFTLSKKLKDGTTKDIAVVDPDESGKTTFEFKGLDDGDYVLTETETPSGYNSIDPITFTVTANHDIEWTTKLRDEVLTSLSGNEKDGNLSFTATTTKTNLENGTEKTTYEGDLVVNVVNKAGSSLPSTGGIGTTIFYIIGGILMVGAAILLITKRRAEN